MNTDLKNRLTQLSILNKRLGLEPYKMMTSVTQELNGQNYKIIEISPAGVEVNEFDNVLTYQELTAGLSDTEKQDLFFTLCNIVEEAMDEVFKQVIKKEVNELDIVKELDLYTDDFISKLAHVINFENNTDYCIKETYDELEQMLYDIIYGECESVIYYDNAFKVLQRDNNHIRAFQLAAEQGYATKDLSIVVLADLVITDENLQMKDNSMDVFQTMLEELSNELFN